LLLVRIAVVVVAMVEIVSSAVETEDHAHRVEIEDRAHRVEIEGHVHRVEIEGHAHRGIVHHVHREIDRRVHRGIVHLVLSRHQQIQPHQLRGEQCSQLNSRLQHRNRPMLATRRASRGESKPCYWHRHEQSIADSIAVA
jgi:hypothetical protein